MDNSTTVRDDIWLLSQDLLLAAHIDGTIFATNPSWSRWLGWDEPELRGMEFFGLAHPDDLQRTVAKLKSLSEGATTAGFDGRYRRKDGSYQRIAWMAVRNRSHLYAIGRVLTPETGSGKDPSNSGEAFLHDQKNEALGRFAAIVAHDFNNLLQGIVGSIELVGKLIEMGRVEETKRFLASAMSSAKRAATMTDRLHVFSNRRPFDARSVDVNDLIYEMENLLRRSLTPSVELSLALSATVWPTVCDAKQFENAMLHLVANSCQALPAGGRIVIETSNESVDETRAASLGAVAQGQYVCVAVADPGTGMSEKIIQQAFDPLFTTKPTGLLAGLGLATVYQFARQHGGCATIHSEIGRGTTVRLYLPRTPIDEHHASE